MTKKKDLEHLHVRIKPITSAKLRDWSDDLGYSIGEVIDFLVQNYEEECNNQDNEIEKADISSQLTSLMEKIDKIGRKVGIE